MLPLLLALIRFSASFDGGNIGRVEPLSALHFRAHVAGETDQDKRNRQASWYYFRVDGARPSEELTFELAGLAGEYNYKPNEGAIIRATPPYVSYDQRTWTPLAFEEGTPLTFRLKPSKARFWVAHQPPYTGIEWKRLADDLRKSTHVQIRSIGKSVEGREIPLVTITDAAPAGGKKVIWLFFRQHAWESGSSWVGEGALRYLVSPEAANLRRRAIFHVFPLCDPDGVARGGVRFNKHGYDLNRNWDAIDPVKMPEIAAQHGAIDQWLKAGKPVDMVVTVHNTETAEYLEGSPGPEHRDLLDRFAGLLAQSPRYQASRGPSPGTISTTPGKPGRMSVYQGLYAHAKLATFLIELRVSLHPKLGRIPMIADRLAFGRDLATAAFSSVINQ